MNHAWIKARICGIIHSAPESSLHAPNGSSATISYQKIVNLFGPDLFDDVIDVLTKMYEENHIVSRCGEVSFRLEGKCQGRGLRNMILSYIR